MAEELQQVGYKTEQRCKVCMAMDNKGNSLRARVDGMVLEGETQEAAAEFLRSEGVSATAQNVFSHLKKHSPYIMDAKKAGTKAGRIIKVHAEIRKADADGALQKIVDMGSTMVQNWWDKIEGAPQLPVTERLYIEALKEQGKRSKTTVLDAMLIELDRELIDSEQFDADQHKVITGTV